MKHEKIVSQDLELLKLIVIRKLRDTSCGIDPSAITIFKETTRGGDNFLCVRYVVKKLPITVRSRSHDERDEAVLTADRLFQIAREQVEKIESIWDNLDYLAADVRDTATIARREVAKANRRGLMWKLVDVRPSSLTADDNFSSRPVVRIELPGRSQSPKVVSIGCEYPDDIIAALANLKRRETEAELLRTTYLSRSNPD